MKCTIRLAFAIAGSLAVYFCPPAAAAGVVHDFSTPPAKAELLIKFKDKADSQQKANALRNSMKSETILRSKVRQRAGGGKGETLHRLTLVPGADISTEIARLSQNGGVEFVEPNYTIKIESNPIIPNDFEFSRMYALQNNGENGGKASADIRATEAWSYSIGSTNVVVAVIDTGIDYFHQDLTQNLWRNPRELPSNGIDDDGNGYVDDWLGFDFVSRDSDPFDDHGHGTHVAGTIGAAGNNGIGTVGVCWQVTIIPVKAFDENGNGTVADAIDSIRYAVANGARVINASWSLQERSRALEEAVQFATENEVLFVAAAGNSKTDTLSFPAAYDAVVAVGATDEKDYRAGFSNYGAWVSVAAPGANILSTLPENNYGIQSGTSMAAPHVSGVAALVLSRFPEYSREELREILINSVDAVLIDKPLGNGRINAAMAVQMDQPLPICKLSLPEKISGVVQVIGSVYGRYFTGYSLRAASLNTPNQWVSVAAGVTPVTNGFLSEIDTSLLPDGEVIVQLIATNQNGTIAVKAAHTRVQNIAIFSPLSGDIFRPGVYPVKGSVFSEAGTYSLAVGGGLRPTTWTEISSGDVKSIQDGHLGSWDASSLTNGFYALRLAVTNGSKATEFTAPAIYIEDKLKQGWPVYLPRQPDFPSTDWRMMRAADLDGDGKSEFIIVDPSTLQEPQTLLVHSISGELLWSKELGFDVPPDLPAIGDLDQDGKLEVVVDGSNGILAFRHDGSMLTNGWPIQVLTRNHAKVLADLDLDGQSELITFSQEYVRNQVQEMRQLSVFKSDGTLVRKWALPWCGSTNELPKIHPAVGNIDADPELEIVAFSGCSEVAAFDYRADEPKWRALISGALLSSPVIGDVDGNGEQDVVVGAAAENGLQKGGIYIFNGRGQAWPGWPVLEEISFMISPSLGDLDRDGRLEIVVPAAKPMGLHVLQWDGFEADGWPKEMFFKSTQRAGVTLANIDGDEECEILLAAPGYPLLSVMDGDLSWAGGISAWKISGEQISLTGDSPIKTFPMEVTPMESWHKAAPGTIGDFDGDGRLDYIASSLQEITLNWSDIVFKDRSSLYLWSLDGSTSNLPLEWPMFANDVGNRGHYSLPLNPSPGPTNQTFAVRDRLLCPEDQFFRFYPLRNDLNATTSPLSVRSFTQPEHGYVVRLNDNSFYYIPQPDYTGSDKFDYTIGDVAGNESTVSVLLMVKAINDPPKAENIPVTVNRNSSVDIFFSGKDDDGDILKYRVISAPENGELWNYPSIATYYPKKDFSGVDSFTYVSNDGRNDSAPATVTITVLSTNNPPSVASQSVMTKANRSVSITPISKDIDEDELAFVITAQPSHGTAEIDEDSLIYHPETDYIGPDQFFVAVFDGMDQSVPARISILVITTNAAPVALPSSLTVQPNSSTELIFRGADPDGDPVQFTILISPLHGELSGEGPKFIYTPVADYEGPDRISFKVSDGILESKAAVVDLNVIRQNRAPNAEDQSVSVITGVPIVIPLMLSDADNDPLHTIILKGPVKGMVYGAGTNYFYVPKPGVLGVDQFTFKGWDGQKFGNVGTVTVYINETPSEIPPVLEGLTIADGMVKIQIRVPDSGTFRIETSTNLPMWFTISERLVPQNNQFTFSDTNAVDGSRFYRAVKAD